MNCYLITLSGMMLFSVYSFASVINVPFNQPSIQAGINAATTGDTVLVADSTYYENINFMGKAITVASHFLVDNDTTHISNTIIDGSQSSDPDSGSVVYFISGEDTTSVLCGFTIRGGSGTSGEAGGGILCIGVSGVKIISNHITNNLIYAGCCAMGGGLFYRGQGFLILKKNQFYQNYAFSHWNVPGDYFSSGGAVYVEGDSVPVVSVIQDNDFTGNYARLWWSGPAGKTEFFNTNDTIDKNCFSRKITRLRNDIFDPFGYGLFAGAVELYKTIATVSNNHFEQNTARDDGGAIRIIESVFQINNNIFAKNTAESGVGGAVCIYSPSQSGTGLDIINNTFVNNSASSGGGIYIDSTQVNVLNSILWGNLSNQIDTCRGGSIIINFSDIQGGASGIGNIDTDPLFEDTLNFYLSESSLCIDEGDPDSVYNDPEDPNNPGYALWPAMGTVRNDMGAYGGPGAKGWIITGIDDKNNLAENIPIGFQLKQNYPNPFNPSTTIEFFIPKADQVKLKVYNILGQEVVTLLKKNLHRENINMYGMHLVFPVAYIFTNLKPEHL